MGSIDGEKELQKEDHYYTSKAGKLGSGGLNVRGLNGK